MAKHRLDEHDPHAHGDHDHDHHDHAHEPQPGETGAAYWDERYGEQHAMWSGNPNPQLEHEASKLTPGRALEVGAGEGADAIWLADQGWAVTAIDISQVALERAREHAGDRDIAWQQADLLEWTPPAEGFDLVSAQYFHLGEPDFTRAMMTLASAVAHGGTLLVSGHAPVHLEATDHRHAMLLTPAEIRAVLAQAPGEWQTIIAETRTRPAVDHPSGQTELTDAVVVLKRV